MTATYAFAGALLVGIALGMCAPSWLESRRRAQRVIAEARAEVATPARAVGDIRSVKGIRAQAAFAADAAGDIDREWREVSGA